MPLPPRTTALRIVLPVVVAVATAITTTGVALAGTTNPNPSSLELHNAKLARQAAGQGMVLLENHDRALPLPSSGNVALFGVGAYKTVKGGTGSGDVNQRYVVNVRQGLTNAGYSVTTSDAYWNAMTSAYDTKYGSVSGILAPPIDYASVEQPLTATSVAPTAATDTAIFVVARSSGEGADRSSGPGDYQLTTTETADITLIGQTYRHVVVVLNTGGIVDTSFYKQINAGTTDPDGGQAIDSLLLMSQAGEESGNAVTDVLSGKVDPSGKLTDTWASKYSYYPASATFANNDGDPTKEQYSEGIYVGYRYFDSFYKSIDAAAPASVVDYPFGYGLSYTDFKIAPMSVTANMSSVVVRARVTNTGSSVKGSEVVQVYFSAPQTGLDKPYQQLAGYAKTDLLAPGASQVVRIRFTTTGMASYDESTASYVMDAGKYAIRVGDSSRNTHVAATIKLAHQLTTERVAHELNTDQPSSELTSNPADFYSYPGEQAELASAPTTRLETAGFKTADDTSPYQQDVPVDSSSPYYAIDGSTISSATAYVDRKQTDWEGTGAPYQARTGETVRKVSTDPAATLFDVAQGKTSMKQFVAGMSVDQLSNLVEGATRSGSTRAATGAAGYTTGTLESRGVPVMTLSDGPAGLRLPQVVAGDPTTYQFGTAWPIGTLLAQTWDRALVSRVGTAVGKEMAKYGVSLWLAPGMNIHRDPLNGRNFEYYSEDPLVAGLSAAAMTEGVQSIPGEGVTIKHFAANNQETDRQGSDSVIGERALREIYLRGFQIAVQTAQPMAVMSSYNKINGYFTAGEYDLLTNLLRGEWGFKGLVMSDWGGTESGPVAAQYAGNDLIMPGLNPAEVATVTKKVVPPIDVDGFPVVDKTVYTAFNATLYRVQLGSLTLAADGSQTISTTVDSSTDLSKAPAGTSIVYDANFNPTVQHHAPYASVAEAYADVTSLLASTALTDAQKAAVSVTNVVHQTPGDDSTPVVAYTVTIKGDYPTSYPMRLGDLQRSAMNILNIAMQSAQFQQLAAKRGISGISVGSYTGQFGNLLSVLSSSLGPVVKH